MRVLIDTEKKRAEIVSPVTVAELRSFLKAIDPEDSDGWTICVKIDSITSGSCVSTTWISGSELSSRLDVTNQPSSNFCLTN
jgi:hypothetical protein